MGLANSIRSTVRNLIDSLGKTCSLYDYGNATKTENEEGDISVTEWGTATSFKAVSSNNLKYVKLGEMMGIETDTGLMKAQADI